MNYPFEGTTTAPGILTSNGRLVFKQHPASNPDVDVDLSIFGVREIRDVLKSKAHCLHAGFSSNHIIIKTLNEIRQNYIRRVGLPTYLNQMLGDLGTVQIQNCKLYGEDNRLIDVRLGGNHNQPVQRFIAKQFRTFELPFKVEVRREPQAERIDVRYL